MELSCVNLSRIEDGHTDIQLFTLFNIFQGIREKIVSRFYSAL